MRLLVVACAVFGVAAAVAWATGFPGGFVARDGSITACVGTNSGNIRLIDPSSSRQELRSCRPDEQQIKLNVQGPKGDPGPPGPAGSEPGPASVTVNCAAGQSINQALAMTSDAPSVTITIDGTCTEDVGIQRDDVTLQAGPSGGGITSDGGDAALGLDGARRITITGLTLSGGPNTLVANAGSSFEADNVTVTGGAMDDVRVTSESSGVLSGGTVSNSQSGVQADGGDVSLDGGVVIEDNASVGVVADHGGDAVLAQVTVEGNAGGGVQAYSGATASLTQSNTLVENNSGGQ